MSTLIFDWMEHYPAAVSVCDTQGTIVAMNRMAAAMFAKYGGEQLIGSSLFACHPEPANVLLRALLKEQRANTYFTEKKGERKLVHQAPWYDQEQFAGLVETVIVLPPDIPTKQRN
ncbi:MAG: PAS domain-containing protein [Desulfobulbus sp.]|nr:PAS domain-containing protein [Desulfobulbus sp.]